MVDSKDFMVQFLQYLQSYYGGKSAAPLAASPVGNILKMPIFQEGLADLEAVPPQFPDMGQGMDQGMGMADQLNGLFPGPYDPMRLN